MNLEDTEELYQDIQMHLKLEKNEKTLEFWRALIVVADDRLSKLRANEAHYAATGVTEGVKHDVDRVLSGKTYAQLEALQQQIMRKLGSNEPIDVEYWENLLRELVVYKAKAKLTDMHQEMLASRLVQLRTRQQEEARKVQEELEKVLSMQEIEVHGRGVEAGEGINVEPVDQEMTEEQDRTFEAEAAAKQTLAVEPYERGMSPEPISHLNRDDRELPMVDPIDDLRELVRGVYIYMYIQMDGR